MLLLLLLLELLLKLFLIDLLLPQGHGISTGIGEQLFFESQRSYALLLQRQHLTVTAQSRRRRRCRPQRGQAVVLYPGEHHHR
jgi:hypothetical protein